MADPRDLPPERAAAGRRLLHAMAVAPFMVSGSAGFATAVMRAAGEAVRLKPGAEGVQCAALPGLGLGLALKIEDGAGRASEVAAGALLVRLGAFDERQRSALAPLLRPKVKNVAGREVGEIRPAAALES
jgi:L-asparaginase II